MPITIYNHQRISFRDPGSFIYCVEIGDHFVTIYMNSNEPGLPDSIQRILMNKLDMLTEIPTYHNPDEFHIKDTVDEWSKPFRNVYACHYHVIYKHLPNINQIRQVLKAIEGFISPQLTSCIINDYNKGYLYETKNS